MAARNLRGVEEDGTIDLRTFDKVPHPTLV